MSRAAVASGLALLSLLAAATGPRAAGTSEDELQLLQTFYKVGGTGRNRHDSADASAAPGSRPRDLVFTHLPYNFGHTVEKTAAWGSGPQAALAFGRIIAATPLGMTSTGTAPLATQPPPTVPGVAWGFLSPELWNLTSSFTGCPLYLTPPKYWPMDLAAAYFGSRKGFGILRDPYERLVAIFRGNGAGYSSGYKEAFETCDVNQAIKTMMKMHLAGANIFRDNCIFVPQSEYFDGPYGVALPVDNRNFPASVNQVFAEHGYPEMRINLTDILHVTGCPQVWPGDLDNETRALVRMAYRKDFDLLCKHFGHCNVEENTCIWQVPTMCPDHVMSKGYNGTQM